MVSDLTSSSLGANGVICLLNSSNISNAVRFLELNFTVSKPAASAREKEKKSYNGRLDMFSTAHCLPCTSGIRSTIKFGSLLSQTTFVLIMHRGFDLTGFGVDNWNTTSLENQMKCKV